jgi:hypothetical protein
METALSGITLGDIVWFTDLLKIYPVRDVSNEYPHCLFKFVCVEEKFVVDLFGNP